MFLRTLTASALGLLLVSPAFADCQEEVSSLDEAVIAAQTGAGTGDSEMPATEHQEEVVDENRTDDETADAGDVAGAVDALSPHQREVLRELPDEERTQVGTLLGEARDMAAAGDEQGCMDKLAEAKTLLGLEE